MLDWRTMSEAEFNRIVENLLRRSVEEDNPGVSVTALDGRGGDGGIDVVATTRRTDQLIAIYQLKFFPEGFSGAWAKARKPQIRRSFESILGIDAPVWYLVVPRNLTPGERTFLRSLQGKRQRPRTRYLGGVELDGLLARFPEIDQWAQRDPLRTALEIAHRSTAALSRPEDVGLEVENLVSRVSPRSDYWDINFSRTGDSITEELVAKRHDAGEREPLHLTITTDFTNHPDLQTSFQRSIDFGLSAPLVLPEDVVREFEQHGPEWFAGKRGPGRLEFYPLPQVFKGPSSITLLGLAERVLAQRPGRTATFTSGTQGGRLTIELEGHVVVNFTFDRGTPANGQLNVTSNVAGLSGTAAKRDLSFLSQLSRAEKLIFNVDGRSSTAFITAKDIAPEVFEIELADDLAYIEGVLDITLRYPEVVDSLVDRVWVRVVRRILEGKVSLMPGVLGMNFVLNGEPNPALDQLLESDSAVRQWSEQSDINIFGQLVALDGVSMLMPAATANDGKEHLAAVRSGRGSGRKVELVPTDGVAGILIWSAERIGDLNDLTPTPWGISGVREHRQLQRTSR